MLKSIGCLAARKAGVSRRDLKMEYYGKKIWSWVLALLQLRGITMKDFRRDDWVNSTLAISPDCDVHWTACSTLSIIGAQRPSGGCSQWLSCLCFGGSFGR